MELSPRYDGQPVISIDGPLDAQRIPVLRQRRRLEAMLVALDADAWGTQSRCEAWSVQDVVAHLVSVNAFWNASMLAGLAGTPTRFLAGFDPNATPALMVEGTRVQSPAEVCAEFVASNDALLGTLEALDDRGWSTIAETPAGHVEIRLLAQHALWDSWLHERDIALPLGTTPPLEPDEVGSCLRYAAALSPAFAITSGGTISGTFAVETTDPAEWFTLEIGEAVAVREGAGAPEVPCLRGSAVDLVEALSLRCELPDSAPIEWVELLGGLQAAFS